MNTQTFKTKKPLAQTYFIEANDELVKLGNFFTVGRHPSNDLVFLEDAFISQKHCRIEKASSGGYILKDLKSKNGTLLNGEKILEAPLKPYDEIQVGNSHFVYRESLEIKTGVPNSFYNSKNKSWNRELKRIPALGASDMPVLVMGPSGAGKEYIAKSLHFNSSRAYGEMVNLNCSAFSEQLIESELFGHIEGAFTGATKNRKGAFQQAKGGTLLLDEIGDLPLNLQPKLLRALENKEIRPVGSDKTIKTDVRIIASTHKNLFEKVESGEFREDLFYRLSALTVTAPKLINRMEDFETLLFDFAREFRVRFSPEAVTAFKKHDWPGNIRELKNLIMRASVIYSKTGVNLEEAEELLKSYTKPQVSDKLKTESTSTIKNIEKQMIMQTLKDNKGNQRKTAQDLGMPKSTLHDKIKRYLSE